MVMETDNRAMHEPTVGRAHENFWRATLRLRGTSRRTRRRCAFRFSGRSGVLGKLHTVLVWSLIFSFTAMAQEQTAHSGLLAPNMAGPLGGQSAEEQAPASLPPPQAEPLPPARGQIRSNESQTASSESDKAAKPV